MKRTFLIGTRGSKLARWQAESVKTQLTAAFPDLEFSIQEITTSGDRFLDLSLEKIGGKGIFVKEIENALLSGRIDFAVHSLKDMPTLQPDGTVIAAVLEREKPNDVLIAKTARSIADLPANAEVATGSSRRRSQLLAIRPDIKIADLRGNVPTRIEKLNSTGLDAIVLAYAGVHRLGLDEHISQIIPTEQMLPAVGQGCIAIQTRTADEAENLALKVNHAESFECAAAERAFLRELEGGCLAPVGALAKKKGHQIELSGFVGSLDGESSLRRSLIGKSVEPETLGTKLAREILAAGAGSLLNSGRSLEETEQAA